MTDTPGKTHWRKLSNVFKGVVLFKQSETSLVEDIDLLVENVRSRSGTFVKKKSYGDTTKAIIEHRLVEKLFSLIATGSQSDLDKIDKLLKEEDPKRFIRPSSDPTSLVNRANPNGVRPIVEAARYGYYHIVQLLLESGANPHLSSKAGPREEENALEVASRWNHYEIVQLLLRSAHWTKTELRFARRATVNEMIDRSLAQAMPKGSWWGCFACSKSK
mmetsp:Transcript_19189/g.35057  ORF Transcript_19189/g.35057 Transcript_19189/m.35057 type:complete len:218 (+) Transcript_19189:3-656(+)